MNKDDHSKLFIEGLKTLNRDIIRTIPKSDKHNHSGMGYRLEHLEKWTKKRIPPAGKMKSIIEINNFIQDHLVEHYQKLSGYEFAIRQSLKEALDDSVTLLEMSVDVTFIYHFNNNPEKFVDSIIEAHKAAAPGIDFRPEIGIARNIVPDSIEPLMEACFQTGAFKSIDLYGIENLRPTKSYKDIYRKAAEKGLKLKAHLGEFGSAEDIKEGVEILGLHEVQHGIAAASDKKICRWLSDNNIVLNICPTSNIMLSRVESYIHHPARVLYDEGVMITINSDDIMLFNQNVTDEYLNLSKSGLFTAEELDQIRLNGLES